MDKTAPAPNCLKNFIYYLLINASLKAGRYVSYLHGAAHFELCIKKPDLN